VFQFLTEGDIAIQLLLVIRGEALEDPFIILLGLPALGKQALILLVFAGGFQQNVFPVILFHNRSLQNIKWGFFYFNSKGVVFSTQNSYS
jgi:hypothetical protein